MFLSKTLSVASLGLFVALATGCAAQAASSEDTSSSEDMLEAARFDGSFKLYDELTGSDPACNIYTNLDLGQRGAFLSATLTGKVEGVCKPFLEGARTYALTFDHDSCGSKIYKGIAKIDGETRVLMLTDHRTRVCRDIVPATIIAEEGPSNGEQRTLYSDDGPHFTQSF